MLIALWRGKGVSYALISSQGRLLWRFVQAFSFLTDEVLVLVLLDYACAAQARSLEMTLISSSAGLGFLGMPLEHNLLLSKYRVRTAFSQQWDLFQLNSQPLRWPPKMQSPRSPGGMGVGEELPVWVMIIDLGLAMQGAQRHTRYETISSSRRAVSNRDKEASTVSTMP